MRRRGNRSPWGLWAGVATSTALGIVLATAPAAGADAPPGTGQYTRSDPDRIRSAMRDILSDPRLAERVGFWEWLQDRLSGRQADEDSPGDDREEPTEPWVAPPEGGDRATGTTASGGGWAKVLLVVFTVLAVLAVLAVVGRLIWTLCSAARIRRGRRDSTKRYSRSESSASVEQGDLCERARRLADQGRFREAVRLLMRGLLQWLGGAGVLRIHEGKTNGDYVREFSAGAAGREGFRQFVRTFDVAVYSGRECDLAIYREAGSRLEQVRRNVAERQEN